MSPHTEFALLAEYIRGLPESVREDASYPFRLPQGRTPEEVSQLDTVAGVSLPGDLRRFFEFSYGAQLGEYRLLTAQEISEGRSQLAATYGSDWQAALIPFAKTVDTGDFLLVDPNRAKGHLLAVLDGFHELPPAEWNVICHGIATWIALMIESEFRPFWLPDSEIDDA